MSTIEAPFKQSPLNHRDALEADGLVMKEQPHLTKIMVRGDLDELSNVIKSAVDVTLPETSRSAYKADSAVHWLGPDTLMIVSGDSDAQTLVDKLSDAMQGKSGQITDVSNNYTVIDLSGDHARSVLQKLSTLDLDAPLFKQGAVAGTVFGHSNVVLSCRGTGPDAFDIVIRRSHADYLWCLIANAGYEFGFEKQSVIAGETLRQ